jgi:hypothetical protein
MKIDIPVSKRVIKPLLWLTKFFKDENAVLVCKGYGDDWNYYTGLYWDEDKDAEFNEYEYYRLWVELSIKP